MEDIAKARTTDPSGPYHDITMKNNIWPLNLDSIKSTAPAEAFIDPITGNPLQYKNHGELFSLYGETANIWPK